MSVASPVAVKTKKSVTVASPPNPHGGYKAAAAAAAAAAPAKDNSDAVPVFGDAPAAASASDAAMLQAMQKGAKQPTSLTLAQAKEALGSVLAELKKEKVSDRIKAAREEADGELDLIMEYVVPIFFEVQGHVMARFGFVPNDEGFEAFAKCLQSHEADATFKPLSDELKKLQKEATAVTQTMKVMADDDDDADADDGKDAADDDDDDDDSAVKDD